MAASMMKIESNVSSKANKESKNKVLALKLVTFLLFAAISVVLILPFYSLVITTFKNGAQVIANGMDISLKGLTFKNYIVLFTQPNSFFTWFGNSLFLTVVSVVLQLLLSAYVAYGFAGYDFKGKNFLFTCVLFVMAVPFEILMLPLYSQINNMHLTDTYTGIVLPGIVAAGTVFFFRQYLSGIPRDLAEAGRIDGASEYGIFFRIILPVMKPAFAAMAILNTMGSWNNLLWPLLVLKTSSKFTLPIGINTLFTPYGNNYDVVFVGSFLSILPILIIFLFFQKYIIDGMTAGAVKG
jgi:arabinosaccharide transport system permease protein